MSLTGFRSDSRLISTCMEGRPSQAILSGSVKRDAYLCQQDWVKSPKFREKCQDAQPKGRVVCWLAIWLADVLSRVLLHSFPSTVIFISLSSGPSPTILE